MPTYMSPHKTSGDIDTTHRLSMLKLATEHCTALQCSDFEIERQQVSYTVDTIEHFRAKYPQTPLCFLMGMDSFINFTSWHRWQDILKQCHLVVSHRPGYSIENQSDASNLLKAHQTSSIEQLHNTPSGLIYMHDAHPVAFRHQVFAP